MHKVGMFQCQSVSISIVIDSCLSTTSKSGFAYFSLVLYHLVVRALQYLIFTWSYIYFIVKKFCQFMNSPFEDHLLVNKCILCSVHSTTYFCSSFTPSYDLLLHKRWLMLFIIAWFSMDVITNVIYKLITRALFIL